MVLAKIIAMKKHSHPELQQKVVGLSKMIAKSQTTHKLDYRRRSLVLVRVHI